MDTPASYARAIAYLGDASTIHARTRDEFGRAPPMFVCERIVVERTKGRFPAKLIGSREPDDADGNGFAVRGLVPQMAAPKPKHPPMVINLPARADLDLSIPTELAMAVAKAFGVTVKAMIGHSRDIAVLAARSYRGSSR